MRNCQPIYKIGLKGNNVELIIDDAYSIKNRHDTPTGYRYRRFNFRRDRASRESHTKARKTGETRPAKQDNETEKEAAK